MTLIMNNSNQDNIQNEQQINNRSKNKTTAEIILATIKTAKEKEEEERASIATAKMKTTLN